MFNFFRKGGAKQVMADNEEDEEFPVEESSYQEEAPWARARVLSSASARRQSCAEGQP